MKVLVCGGRDFKDRDWLYAGLDMLHATVNITEIIEGGASGADCLAANWANWRGIDLITVKADWRRYGNAAGYIRNKEMADLNPKLVLAAPGRAGTASMCAIAKSRGIRVIRLEKMPVSCSKKLGAPEKEAPVANR